MDKPDIHQLSLDFTKIARSEAPSTSDQKIPGLTLVHSGTPDAEARKRKADKEEILSEIASYARTLNW